MIIAWDNPWLLDTIRSSDYYRALAKGTFVTDLDSVSLFGPGAVIRIPDSIRSIRVAGMIRENIIVLNIPQFRITILNGSDTLCSCPVRVGRNERVLLETVGHEVDLRTPVGKGKIIRVRRHPISKNLHTGEPYVQTRRDDGRITRMPDIPSLEPILDGNRWGKMIHATTNQATIGKAYSHGCVGVTEACMWTLYFLAPEGTAVEFRYDLQPGLLRGENVMLTDIYQESQPPSAAVRD